MSTIPHKSYDIVIYGATGFTGQFVVEEVARVASLENENGRELKWAVAGRNIEKLNSSLSSAGKFVGQNLEHIDKILADNDDSHSLSNMARQSKVVINCVGPYRLYGESVVKACIENHASHVDISGEPLFLEKMQLMYDEEAQKANVHIVGACGYDAIPADFGLCHLMKNFPGTLNYVEAIVTTSGGHKSSIHTGTMESAAMVIAERSEFQRIRSQLYPSKLPKPKFSKPNRGVIHKNDLINRWCLPLPSDEPVVYRTQRHLFTHKNAHPVQFQGFVGFKKPWEAFGVLLAIVYFAFMCSFNFTRRILFKYPEILTAGVFTRSGPKREHLADLKFRMTLIGMGWKSPLPKEENSSPPNTQAVLEIEGGDPGYGMTSLFMVASAMTILREKSSLEGTGGVMTPGVAFMNTKLMDRLMERGLKVSFRSNIQ